MKREIKFRAWNIANKIWIDLNGFDVWFGNHPNKGAIYKIYEQGNLGSFKSNDVELMQFSGLKDKNRKDVYEGDIVWGTGYGNQVVEYSERLGAFGFKSKTGFQYFPLNFDYLFTIIGNIYENPELIKP